MTILRPSCYGDSEWNFRVFEASLLWGNTEDRTAGNERERDRVREREREIPHEKNPLGVFQIGELYLVESRRGERRMDGREVGWRSEVVEI